VEQSLAGVFSAAAARDAATHWGYSSDASLELLCVSENATYLVRDSRGGEPAVLRLNRPGYHDRAALASELAWTAALRESNVVLTPQWHLTTAGEPVACLGAAAGVPRRHAVLFGYAPGEHPGDTPGSMPAQIGELAARLHHHARYWRKPKGFYRFSWDLTDALGDGPGKPGRWGDWRVGLGAAESGVLQAAETQLRQGLSAYGYAPERYGLIHADLRAANLLVSGDGAESMVSVIDFDDCGYAWYFYDLAASVSFLEHRPQLPELVVGWLSGYRRAAGRVDPADLAALPSLVMLRRLQLQAWSSSHADTEMVRSLGPEFAAETVEVAERYLSSRLLAGIT
jgi:Ser/Thr protein kinase RdoA (MazF antagonist)